MSQPSDDEREIDLLLRDTLGDLVPTTEAAVERAEAQGVAHEGPLPAGLASFRGLDAPAPSARAARAGAEVLSLDEARLARAGQGGARSRGRSALTHVAVGLASAAAAAIVLLATRPTQPPGAGRDLPGSASADPAPPARIVIDDGLACSSSCCAGSACESAAPELSECPSGRACISCAREDLAAAVYRFRVGGFAPADKFRKQLAAGPLEVCVRVAGSEQVCGPAHTAGDVKKWTELPLPVTGGDTLGGVSVAIRFAGAKEALAEWSEPLAPQARGLCHGYLIQPMFRTGEPLGTLSAFLVDSHYVELGRAASVEPLKAERLRYETGLVMQLFETDKAGAERFALVLGPFGKAQAERVRWSILERGGNATPSQGADHLGDGRVLE